MATRAAEAKKRTGRGTAPEQDSTSPGLLRNQSFLLVVLLVIATLAVYWPVSHHPFVNYDDAVYVVDNDHIKSGLDGETISWAFTTFYQFNWHPLTWMSHALDVQMFQLEPGGHHDTNLLFHLSNVLLLFWVLRKTTGYVGRSAMVAGLFALHPVNVESVAWIAERKNLLSMMFFLLALGAYRWYAQGYEPTSSGTKTASAHTAKRGPAVGRYVVVMLLFACGLMSKPQVITFPFLLLLWDYWPLRRMAVAGNDNASGALTEPLLPARSFGWLVLEKLPLFALCAISAVVTVLAQKSGGAVVTLEKYPMSVRLGNAIVSYARYVGKALWPTRLALLYPHPWNPLPIWQVGSALLFLAVITAAVYAFRNRRYLLVGWLWFLGALVPMIGVVHVGNQSMADRYAYLPFIGLFLMVCWGIAEWAEQNKLPVAAMRVAGAIVLLALAVLTYRQVSYWNDNVTLWTHALEVTEDNYIAHDNLAQQLMQRGQPEQAMEHYEAALAIYPSDPTSNLQIATYDHQHGRLPQAIERYDQMIRNTPDGPGRAELFSNRGLVYLDMRDNLHAQESFTQAQAIDPRNYRSWIGAGVVAQRSGDLNLAIQNWKRANDAKPMAITYQLLAKAYDQIGKPDDARAARDRAKLLSQTTDPTQPISGGLLSK